MTYRLGGRFTESKGQGLIVLMVAVIASALIAGLVAVTMVQTLPAIYGKYVDDASLISEAETRHDNIVENFIPLAVHYSVAQASWDEGIEYGWVTGDEDEVQGNWSDEVYAEYDEMIEDVDGDSDAEFRNYIQDFSYSRCQVSLLDSSNLNVDPQFDSQDGMEQEIEVEATNDAKGIMNVTCGSASRNVRYMSSKSYFRVPIVNNRFPQLATLSVGAMAEMENVSEQIASSNKDDGKVSDTSSCQLSSTESGAKDRAETNAENKAQNKIDQIIEAVVREDHGIGSGSGDRGAIEYLKGRTSNSRMCIFGVCTSNWFNVFNNEPVRNVGVISTDSSHQAVSSSASKCGCEPGAKVCDENGFRYETVTDSCTTNSALPSADCTNPDVSNAAYCDTSNLTCSGVQYHGRSTTRSGTLCAPSSTPSPDCNNHKWEGSAEHKYDLDEIDVHVNLTDEETKIPTDSGFKHPKIARRYSRNFETSGSYESLN